jgi:hypothetical protein
MKRSLFLTLGIVIGLATIFCCMSLAGDKPVNRRRIVSPLIRSKELTKIKTARIVSGRLRSKAVAALSVPKGEPQPLKISQARLHSIAETTAILKKIDGTKQSLDEAPIPTSGQLPDSASLLLTPCQPFGSILGINHTSLLLSGVSLGTDDRSIQECVRNNRVYVSGSGRSGISPVMVVLSGAKAGWYVVGGDFAVVRDGPCTAWVTGGVLEKSCTEEEFQYETQRGDELFMPILLHVTEADSTVVVMFRFTEGKGLWLRSVSVQKLQ